MSMKKVYDFVVVGAGIEGVATAYHLSEINGASVLLLDQFPFPNNRGSSSGQTRITRLAYRRPFYVRMAVDAHVEWRKLERKFGQQLYRETGVMVAGPKGSAAFKEYQDSMDASGLPWDALKAEDLDRRFGHLFETPGNYEGLYETAGGVLYGQRCLQAFMKEYLANGGQLLDNVKIEQIIPGEIVTLKTRCHEDLKTRKIVLCLGPWAPKFLQQQLGLQLPIYASKTFGCYWKVTGGDADIYSMDRGVPMVMFREDDGVYFFKSSVEYPGLLYYGLHWGEPCDPDFPNAIKPERYLSKCRTVAKKLRLKIDTSEPAVIENCIYTESSDTDYILDKHPKHGNIVFGTGFSGHGFKLAPIVGKILADLASDRTNSYPVEKFSMHRFKTKSLL